MQNPFQKFGQNPQLNQNKMVQDHHGPMAQQYSTKPIHKQLYKITSKISGRSLDICQDGQMRGHLIIWDYHGGANQQFLVVQQGTDTVIKSRQTNKFLTVAANSTQNGAPILEESLEGMPGQQFRLQETFPSSGEYIIFTFCGKALDVCQQGKKNGTRIIQWEFHGRDNQKWKLEKI